MKTYSARWSGEEVGEYLPKWGGRKCVYLYSFQPGARIHWDSERDMWFEQE
jgi:hypothetical protein